MTPRTAYEYRKWLRRSYYRALWVQRRCMPWSGRMLQLEYWRGLIITSEYEQYHRRTIEMMIEKMDKPLWTIRDFQELIAIRIRFHSTIKSLIRLGELPQKGW